MAKVYRVDMKAVPVTSEMVRIAPRAGDERDDTLFVRDADGTLRPFKTVELDASFKELTPDAENAASRED